MLTEHRDVCTEMNPGIWECFLREKVISEKGHWEKIYWKLEASWVRALSGTDATRAQQVALTCRPNHVEHSERICVEPRNICPHPCFWIESLHLTLSHSFSVSHSLAVLALRTVVARTAVAQWLRCCATNRKDAGSIPDGVIGIFHWHNPPDRTIALGPTQYLTEMSTRRISWG